MHSSLRKNRGIRWGCRLLWSASLAVGLCGCADFWDEVTSRDFQFKSLWHKQTPMEILASSSDGAKRGKALAVLPEPLQHGGTKQDQDKYIELLSIAALKDREPLCRLGAIKALGEYKDPRANKILEDVYLQKPMFTPDINTIIRQQALAGLVAHGDPETRHLLVRVARQPGGGLDSSYADRQQTTDERLTAIRGLGKYKTYDAVDTLIHILETEKDVALRDRAHESLKTATGKSFPAEAKPWREFVDAQPKNPNQNVATEQPSFLKKVLKPLGN